MWAKRQRVGGKLPSEIPLATCRQGGRQRGALVDATCHEVFSKGDGLAPEGAKRFQASEGYVRPTSPPL